MRALARKRPPKRATTISLLLTRARGGPISSGSSDLSMNLASCSPAAQAGRKTTTSKISVQKKPEARTHLFWKKLLNFSAVRNAYSVLPRYPFNRL
jgi:hypothetical protein